MRAAKPDELKTHAYPVLAAAISEAELSNWFPVPFQHITDPEEVAEPSKAALIKLDTGDHFVLFYGELSNQLTLRIPSSVDASSFLQSLFREVPLPRERIVWRRRDHASPVTSLRRRCQLRETAQRRNRIIETRPGP
ncbi:MAG TPA: hypothetical protein VEK79_06165 [Thermoanaerobaculia bacterium]|nr:hypothetical protein [Thermoanaerobaculia bacterium]